MNEICKPVEKSILFFAAGSAQSLTDNCFILHTTTTADIYGSQSLMHDLLIPLEQIMSYVLYIVLLLPLSLDIQ